MNRVTTCVNAVGVIALAVLCITLGSGPARAADPSFLTIGGGAFDFNDDQTTAQLAVEYRSGNKDFYVKPFVGAMVNADAGGDIYAGILLDIYFGRRWVVTPNFAPSIYWKGSGKDLGHSLEFRSGIEVAYRFDDRSRIGVAVHHLSNAKLSNDNPGTELFTVFYSIPLGGS